MTQDNDCENCWGHIGTRQDFLTGVIDITLWLSLSFSLLIYLALSG